MSDARLVVVLIERQQHQSIHRGHACPMTLVGLRDGLIENAAPVPDTEHPAGAMYHLTNVRLKRACVIFLDVVPHLKDERTLRAWRDLVSVIGGDDTRMVMIDQQSDRQDVVRSLSTPFTFPLPDVRESQAWPQSREA